MDQELLEELKLRIASLEARMNRYELATPAMQGGELPVEDSLDRHNPFWQRQVEKKKQAQQSESRPADPRHVTVKADEVQAKPFEPAATTDPPEVVFRPRGDYETPEQVQSAAQSQGATMERVELQPASPKPPSQPQKPSTPTQVLSSPTQELPPAEETWEDTGVDAQIDTQVNETFVEMGEPQETNPGQYAYANPDPLRPISPEVPNQAVSRPDSIFTDIPQSPDIQLDQTVESRSQADVDVSFGGVSPRTGRSLPMVQRKENITERAQKATRQRGQRMRDAGQTPSMDRRSPEHTPDWWYTRDGGGTAPDPSPAVPSPPGHAGHRDEPDMAQRVAAFAEATTGALAAMNQRLTEAMRRLEDITNDLEMKGTE